MGTLWTITLYAPDQTAAETGARAAFARVAELDARFTDYAPDSELSMLRYAEPGKPVPVSPDLFDILDRSLQISRRTSGAFDMTVGPYVHLWRTARKSRILPEQIELAEAARAVGWQKVKLDARRQTVTVAASGMKLDLGGIAKGYGADAALEVLKQRRLPRALVAASGDIAVGDPPPDKAGWIIGIAALDEGDGVMKKLLSLRNCGVSTSGDTEQFVVIGGVRYSHIVDPRTGIGLTNRIQATVIARDATTSDAMAKGVCMFGPERGRELIDGLPGAAALVLTADDAGKKQYASKRFRKLPAVE